MAIGTFCRFRVAMLVCVQLFRDLAILNCHQVHGVQHLNLVDHASMYMQLHSVDSGMPWVWQ